MSNPGGAVATEAGHWYLPPNGVPFYTIEGKNGEQRNVTLRDARRVGAVPSVTTIIRCADAPALTRYYINQALLAGCAIPRDELEDDKEWMARVLAKSKEHSEIARDAGTAIHGNIEKCLMQQPYEWSYHVDGAIATLEEWCSLEELRPERSFYHPLGYGGKCDVHKKPSIDLDETHNGFVADFKSKDFAADNLPNVYDNHFMQLAAYREGFEMPQARCAIIYVSTSVPGLTHLVEVDEANLQRGWEMFKALLTYWQHQKRYVPQALAA
jgi:hypothetical protein